MAFGLMVKKWGILNQPLSMRLQHVKFLIVCIAWLHNFYINEHILWHGFSGFEQNNYKFSLYEEAMRATAATYEFEEAEELFNNPGSQNCDQIMASKNMSQPKKSRSNNML
jgi:hypothetical protein